ncbi:ABC transporter ATP-binding protein [Microbacterium sp. EST19A]|uniref:ABC transporter ATP-binding protein n=1 Tax=Microbacterium sp. EST19A TaxID=2862681 RepID=UPI001CBA9183|nr:ABC transporter ATP-binding protein [Microbacterium sp. EST19A]
MTTDSLLLQVDGLRVAAGRDGETTLVDGVSLSVAPGECLGLVGESGSGKSLTLRSVLSLLPPSIRQTAGAIRLADDAGVLAERHPKDLRGNGVSMIFQEPMSSLNPTMRIGDLVAAGARAHGQSRAEARRTALRLLEEVGIPDPQQRLRAWPHELSGGLRQRVMIAMALSVEPRLLLCDEPTTALDATIQDQILTLLERLRRERGLAVVFVSHDLGVISRIADRTAVMYAGTIVEEGPTAALISAPRHPYTRALVASMPSADRKSGRLATIPGSPPTAGQWPSGCRFAPRCAYAIDECRIAQPALVPVAPERTSACLRDHELQEMHMTEPLAS